MILAPFDVVLADDQVLQPDIMFVAAKHLHLIKDNGVFGAPDLAVEVLSPSSRRDDTGRKRELYFQYDCEELWIIDPDELTVVLSVRGEKGWQDTLLSRDDVLVSPAPRGFRLPIRALTREYGSRWNRGHGPLKGLSPSPCSGSLVLMGYDHGAGPVRINRTLPTRRPFISTTTASTVSDGATRSFTLGTRPS